MPDGIKISQLTQFPGKKFADVVPFSGGDPFGSYSYTVQTLLNLGVTGLTGGGTSNLDGTPTAEEDPLQIWNVVTTGNLLSPYQLQTSTAAQSSPNIIRPLDFDSGNNPKVFQILGFKGLSLTITGTAGAGFVEMLAQSGAPTLSSTAARLYADASYRPSWIQPDGYTRTFSSTLTDNRVYTLPDASGTVALTASSIPSIAGTSGQVLVNGGTVAVTGGAVTLSLATALVSVNSIAPVTTTDLTLTGGTSGAAINLYLTGNGPVRIGPAAGTYNTTGRIVFDSSTTTAALGGIWWGTGTNIYVTAVGAIQADTTASAQTFKLNWNGGSSTWSSNTFTNLSSITSVAGAALVLATGTSGTAVTIASATNLVTLAGNLTVSGGTITGATTLTGVNTITSVAGQPLVLATGTTGTAISVASATNITTFTAAISGTSATLSSTLQTGNVTVGSSGAGTISASTLTSAAGSNLVLALGTGGTALTLTTSTLAATFAGTVAGAFNGTIGATTPAAATVTSLTNSSLTSGRVALVSTAGLMADSASLLFSSTSLTVGTAVINGAAATTISGGNGNMTIGPVTGNASRTLALQSTTSGGTATTFLTGNADQSVTTAGPIINGIGSASAPSYSFTGVPTWGMYKTADGVSIGTAGVEIVNFRQTAVYFASGTSLYPSGGTSNFGSSSNKWTRFYATNSATSAGSLGQQSLAYGFDNGDGNGSNGGIYFTGTYNSNSVLIGASGVLAATFSSTATTLAGNLTVSGTGASTLGVAGSTWAINGITTITTANGAAGYNGFIFDITPNSVHHTMAFGANSTRVAVGTTTSSSLAFFTNNSSDWLTIGTTGISTFAGAVASTSTTTGTVVVTGGQGISGSLFIGGNIDFGTALTSQLLTYHSGNTKYGLGAVSGSMRVFAASGASLVELGNMSTSDGTTFTAVATFNNSSSLTTLAGALTMSGTLTGAATLTGTNTITAAASTDLTLNGGSSGASWALKQGSSGNGVLSIPGTGQMQITGAGTNNNTALVILNSSSGYTNLAVSRSVSPSELAVFGISNDATVYFGSQSAHPVKLYASNAEVARITTTANILIGTTTDMSGSGGLKVAGTTASTSTTTGSLINAGGFGNAGAAWIGGLANIAGVLTAAATTEATTGGAGSLVAAGGIYATKKIITASSLTTGAPNGGTAGVWKLGSVVTGVTSTFVTTNYVELDIGGTLYKLGTVTSVP